MEGCKIFVPSTLKIPDHFQFVPFVSATNEANYTTKDNISEKNGSCCNLSGEEASLFYKEIISSPPTRFLSRIGCKKKDQVTIKNKISSTLRGTHKHSTIFHCAQEGNIEGIEHFLSKQCHVDIQDMYGWTPLMCATFEGHYAVAEYLIKNGAKLDIKNKQELTSLDIAIKKNHVALVNLFKTGIVDETAHSDRELEDDIKYCSQCECSYVESTTVHERSIAHLFSSKRIDTSTYYCIPENNKGFQIMLKNGWDKNSGLGVNENGRKFPVKTVLKTDRICIGGKKEIPKVTHFGPHDFQSVVKNHPTENLKKDKRFKKWKLRKLENKNRQIEIEFRRQFHAE